MDLNQSEESSMVNNPDPTPEPAEPIPAVTEQPVTPESVTAKATPVSEPEPEPLPEPEPEVEPQQPQPQSQPEPEPEPEEDPMARFKFDRVVLPKKAHERSKLKEKRTYTPPIISVPTIVPAKEEPTKRKEKETKTVTPPEPAPIVVVDIIKYDRAFLYTFRELAHCLSKPVGFPEALVNEIRQAQLAHGRSSASNWQNQKSEKKGFQTLSTPRNFTASSRSQQKTKYDNPRHNHGSHNSHHNKYDTRKKDYGRSIQNVAPLQKTDNRWERNQGNDDEEKVFRKKVNSFLNKLTLDKFDSLSEQVLEYIAPAIALGYLSVSISIIFEKAMMEPTFSRMYADLCVFLAIRLPQGDSGNPPPSSVSLSKTHFAKALVMATHSEYVSSQEFLLNPESCGLVGEELTEKVKQVKNRMFGTVRFVGDLYNVKLIANKLIRQEIIEKLLVDPSDTDLECVCRLLTTIGKRLEREGDRLKDNQEKYYKFRNLINMYFSSVDNLSNNTKYSNRTRYMCKDLIDLRANKWVPRIIHNPLQKTLAETKKDHEREGRSGSSGGSSTGGRRGSSGGGRHRSTSGSGGRRSEPRDRYSQLQDNRPHRPRVTSDDSRPPRSRNSSDGGSRDNRSDSGSYDTTRRRSSAQSEYAGLSPGERKSLVERRTRSLIEEFVTNGDATEARRCLLELQQDHHHWAVAATLELFINIRDVNKQHRELVLSLILDNMEGKSVISVSNFRQGVELFLPSIADMDFPNASVYAGEFLCHFIDRGYVGLNHITAPSCIEYWDRHDKARLLGGILSGIYRLRGEAAAVDQWTIVQEVCPNMIKAAHLAAWRDKYQLHFLSIAE
jgi:translation initiation factor 4G